ncbi:MAG: radical SAM protein [Candidatus Bathyarchaeota archaeon]|nr:radical SAM protein [Candidatus Bathyarchaeota archaeon]MDH5687035.1 radical SAM protein [Candidatus Bathyarchaeota archaeon]
MIRFDKREQHFVASPKTELDANKLKYPLSISLQVTRDCNLNCAYCSEVGDIPNPSLVKVRKMITNLRGVKRIILTGGEPLIRDDLTEIAEYTRKSEFETISLATNGVFVTYELARKLVGLIDYVDVTIDGPRKVHNTIRGKYDTVVDGVRILQNVGFPFSIVTVLFRGNADSILLTCQIADVLGAKKLKIMTPIAKGRGKEIVSEQLSSGELLNVFEKIKAEKETNGWSPRITLTDWNVVGEGHAILVHPNGDVVASPVPSEEECIWPLGNVLRENIKSIWKRYPYKENHLNKYLEKTLHVC